MIELIQEIWKAIIAIFGDWLPLFETAKEKIWEAFGVPYKVIGGIAGIITGAIAIAKFMEKYGIETWGNNGPRQKRKNKSSKEL